MTDNPNILFVVLDTVRAKSLSLHGSELRPDACLKALAESGETFTHAIAPSAWTLPSHVSIFTGRLPSEHGVIAPHSRFNPVGTLPRRFTDEGYATFGASANPFIGPRNGFADAFETFRHVVPTPRTRPFGRGRDALELMRSVDQTGLQKLPEVSSRIASGRAPLSTAGNLLWYKLSKFRTQRERKRRTLSGAHDITDALIRFIRRADRPFFAFANYMEAHRPYCAPEKYVERYYPDDVELESDEVELDPWAHMLGVNEHTRSEIRAARAKYVAAIDYLDDQLRELLACLDDERIREDTIVVVTSDHGEAFGERGRLDHNCLYRPVTHVPLIIDHPERNRDVIDTPVNLRSLYPMLLNQAGIGDTQAPSIPTDADESVISQYLELHVKNLERRFDPAEIEPFSERLQSVFTSEHQLLVGDRGTEELLSNEDDLRPLTGMESVRDSLRNELPPFPEDYSDGSAGAEGPDEELLRSLGYLG